MNRFLKTATLLAALIGVAGSTASAAVIVDKTPNLGEFWHPLDGTNVFGGGGTFVYANSFVFTTGGTGSMMNVIGVYLRNEQISGDPDKTGTPFRFEVYADNGNSPDPTNVLGVTGYQTFSGTAITRITDALLSPIALTYGARYWIAASTVGQASEGSYQVGGHTQNSIYPDSGTFWYSNDTTGQNFDGQNRTPEMAIYAEGDLRPITGAVPEPASLTIWGLGLIGCAFAANRRRKAAK